MNSCAKNGGLVILDRDGVLNQMVVDMEHGTIDGPLHPDQVTVAANIPKAVRRICDLGFKIAIATNQPAAAKNKTTLQNLQAVHARILQIVQSEGGVITSSHICFHRDEDNCACRKPKPQLLLDAIASCLITAPEISKNSIWMVGDGVTDLQAAKAAGVRAAFIGPKKIEFEKTFDAACVKPDAWFENLMEFAVSLKKPV